MYEFDGFGKRIEILRKARGLTQEELAVRLGITSQAVSKWENNASYPDISLLPALCTILGSSLDELFGKIKDSDSGDDNSSRFPKTYKNLNLVFTFGDIGCYSDKEVASTDETNVTFTDGSMAELANRRIINRGQGEIKLLTFKKKNISDDDNSNDNFNLKKSHAQVSDNDNDKYNSFGEFGESEKFEKREINSNFTFGEASNLELNVRLCDCIIENSESGRTTVSLEGQKKFTDSVEVEYSDGKLSVKCKEKFFGIMKQKIWDENKIIIKLARGETVKLNAGIHGQGKLSSNIKFDTANMSIHGSGNIAVEKIADLNMSIHGSGNAAVNEVAAGNFSIHGSGNIAVGEISNINMSIHGSGTVAIGQVSESINIGIFGSGNIDINRGEVKNFTVKTHGGGKVNAENLTTDNAEIKMHGGGNVKIGRVKRQSIEQIHGGGKISILNRGD